MFDDINLLPDELRHQEEAERKKSGGFSPTAEEKLTNLPPKADGENINFKKNFADKKILPPWLKIEAKSHWSASGPSPVQSTSLFNKIKNIFKSLIKPKSRVDQVTIPPKKAEVKPIMPKEIKDFIATTQQQSPAVQKPKEMINKEEKPLEISKPKIGSEGQETKKSIFASLFRKAKTDNFQSSRVPAKKFEGAKFSAGDLLATAKKNLHVNLVPTGQQLKPLGKIFSYFLLTGLLATIIVIVADIVIIYKSYQIQSQAIIQDEKINEKIQVINKLKASEERAKKLFDETKKIEIVLNNHIYWTNFFKALEESTLPNVYYKNLAATSNGAITLSAVTTDYLSVAKQLLVFQQDQEFIQDVKILGAKKEEIINDDGTTSQVISFNISLFLQPAVFTKKLNYE